MDSLVYAVALLVLDQYSATGRAWGGMGLRHDPLTPLQEVASELLDWADKEGLKLPDLGFMKASFPIDLIYLVGVPAWEEYIRRLVAFTVESLRDSKDFFVQFDLERLPWKVQEALGEKDIAKAIRLPFDLLGDHWEDPRKWELYHHWEDQEMALLYAVRLEKDPVWTALAGQARKVLSGESSERTEARRDLNESPDDSAPASRAGGGVQPDLE